MRNMTDRLVTFVRLLMGVIYVINGVNWWFKLITPYPSLSDFATMAPPPDVVGAMIENGVMFHMVKALELLTGIALLTNFMVPLVLVAVLPVTISVFIVDVFFIAHLRGFVMGAGSLVLNVYLLLAYLEHYRGMLAIRGRTTGVPDAPGDGGNATDLVVTLARPVMPLIAALAVVLGLVMLGWLLVMIAQYIANPLPLSAIMPPRP